MYLKSPVIFTNRRVLLSLAVLGLLVGATVYHVKAGAEQVGKPEVVQGASLESGRPGSLRVVWQGTGGVQELPTWTLEQLSKLKQKSTQEQDPVNSSIATWSGVPLSHVLDEALKALPLDRRAQVDLVVLEGASGKQALIPRVFINNYPMLLALARNNRSLGDVGPIYTVVPWTSKSRLNQESLPVRNYFVAGLRKIELTSYNEKFKNWFLKRRTDPVAIRGERIFLHTCIGCHGAGAGPSFANFSADGAETRIFGPTGHPEVKGVPKFSEKDRRSILNYIQAHHAENSPQSAKQTTQASLK